MHLNLHPKLTEEVTALRPLFEDYLKCALWCEEHLMPFYDQIMDGISSGDVRESLEEHSGHTTQQFRRLLEVFDSIGIKPEGRKFEALDKHMKNLETILLQIASGPVRDAAIIAELQQIIHCEIACYGTLRSFAITLKEERVVWLLEENLEEEKAFDAKLTQIARAYVNDEAANTEF